MTNIDPTIDSTIDPQFELLADLGAMIAREALLDELLATFADRVAHAMGAQRATLWMLDDATGELRAKVAVLAEIDELRVPPGRGLVGHVAATGQSVVIDDATRDSRWNAAVDERTGYRTSSMLSVPVSCRNQIRCVLQVLGKNSGTFSATDLQYAHALADQIGRALDYTSLRGDDARRGVRLRGRFNHVVGQSPAMDKIYDIVERAAATDATVLLRGETGTGKGIFARAIHVNSSRREAPMVHVDCTTLPINLVESELFGHERGAYTGADARVIGKVEAADGGTLFLDEVGELPLELQSKLLRFVQDRKFERVGGRDTRSADVRLVAATNRDLAAMVTAGTFRADLYFRLRVIELEIPPLRERGADDVRALAEHFVTAFTRRYRRQQLQLSERALDALAANPWPGNVRELEHAIERAIVLARADADVIGVADLGLDSSSSRSPAPASNDIALPSGLTLAEVERSYAQQVLARAGSNQSLAARELGISRNKLARLIAQK